MLALPFTTADFFTVFRSYNEAVWPAQWALFAVALLAVWLALTGRAGNARWIMALLSVLWLWMGIVYHLFFFRRINPAAALFGAAFVLQGVMFACLAARRRVGGGTIAVRRDAKGIGGGLLVVFALAVYPALTFLLGHRYPEAPTFGLPCPTTILTLGILLWAWPALPRWAFVIPLLWSVVGTTAAIVFGVTEDLGLLAAAVTSVAVLVHAQRRSRDTRPQL